MCCEVPDWVTSDISRLTIAPISSFQCKYLQQRRSASSVRFFPKLSKNLNLYMLQRANIPSAEDLEFECYLKIQDKLFPLV